jgi:DNA-binding beta-propeller fold protein YncE
MRQPILVGFAVVLLALGAGVAYFIPLLSPKQICSAAAPWNRGDASGDLDHPMGIARDGNLLYVADTESGAVKEFGPDGSLVATWSGFKRPVAVAAAPDGIIYVADFLADRVSKLRPDGSIILRWGRHGTGAGEFDAPSGIAVDRQGYVYVADFYNHRIEKFTGAGTFVAQWGRNGRWNGEFHYPTDVVVSNMGEVFVADAYNNRVQKFTADGVYLGKWGGIGYGLSGRWSGWFRLAKAVTIDPAGDVYVADAFNHRIQKFTPDGRLLAVWSNHSSNDGTTLQYPAGIAAGADGSLYVSDFFTDWIWHLDCRSP